MEEELIIKFGKTLEERNILRNQLKDAISANKRHTFEACLFSAMLADISEIEFGRLAKDAPHFLANAHCGWACGPGGKLDDECYVVALYRIRKETTNIEWIKEWKDFLIKIKKMKEQYRVA